MHGHRGARTSGASAEERRSPRGRPRGRAQTAPVRAAERARHAIVRVGVRVSAVVRIETLPPFENEAFDALIQGARPLATFRVFFFGFELPRRRRPHLRARGTHPRGGAGAMQASFDSIRGSPRSSSKVAADPLPTVPDPLIQHLGFPDKFYIVAAFVDDPPEVGVRRVDDDTALLLHALHEQATKGPCAKPRPWSFFETDAQLKWDAWKALEKMPASEAMTLYCRTVEEDNPNWWQLLTATMSAREKREIIETAAECAREYRAFVRAGVLIGPSSAAAPPYLQTDSSAENENEDWAGASAALKAFGLGGLSDVIDFLSSSRPVKPWSRGHRSINHPSRLPPDRSDVVSVSAMKARLKARERAGGSRRRRARLGRRRLRARRRRADAHVARGGDARRAAGAQVPPLRVGGGQPQKRGAADVGRARLAQRQETARDAGGTVPARAGVDDARGARGNGTRPLPSRARPRWSRRTTPRTSSGRRQDARARARRALRPRRRRRR